LWEDVTGLFFESSSTSTNNGSRTRLLIYRVEAGARQGKISSLVVNFDECLIELKKRIPGDAIMAVPGAKGL
jgi:hypothetical protein